MSMSEADPKQLLTALQSRILFVRLHLFSALTFLPHLPSPRNTPEVENKIRMSSLSYCNKQSQIKLAFN